VRRSFKRKNKQNQGIVIVFFFSQKKISCASRIVPPNFDSGEATKKEFCQSRHSLYFSDNFSMPSREPISAPNQLSATVIEQTPLTGERRRRIGEILAQHGRVTVNELSKLFGVTSVTIRSDLDTMAAAGALIRDRGGAIAHTSTTLAVAFEKRAAQNREQKRHIGRLASKLVNERETIILDAGSTVMEMARSLPAERPCTVVTTALNVAARVGALQNVNVLIAGGSLSRETISTVGAIAERDLENLIVDKLFLSTMAFDEAHGLTDDLFDIARVKAAMIRSARRVILLADSSKWGKSAFAKIAPLGEIDILVTDSALSVEAQKIIQRFGVEIMLADGPGTAQ
jgi:DeoR family transcriptional regulator of aga operon